MPHFGAWSRITRQNSRIRLTLSKKRDKAKKERGHQFSWLRALPWKIRQHRFSSAWVTRVRFNYLIADRRGQRKRVRLHSAWWTGHRHEETALRARGKLGPKGSRVPGSLPGVRERPIYGRAGSYFGAITRRRRHCDESAYLYFHKSPGKHRVIQLSGLT